MQTYTLFIAISEKMLMLYKFRIYEANFRLARRVLAKLRRIVKQRCTRSVAKIKTARHRSCNWLASLLAILRQIVAKILTLWGTGATDWIFDTVILYSQIPRNYDRQIHSDDARARHKKGRFCSGPAQNTAQLPPRNAGFGARLTLEKYRLTCRSGRQTGPA